MEKRVKVKLQVKFLIIQLRVSNLKWHLMFYEVELVTQKKKFLEKCSG